MNFRIGTGKTDITGPCVEVGFMGMSNESQKGTGLHTRLFSRAFVIEDVVSRTIAALVVADLAMCSQAVKLAVIDKLNTESACLFQDKPAFSVNNVMISATHTHSGPAGYSQYLAYNASNYGFYVQNFNHIVAGIAGSIREAFSNRRPGKIFWIKGSLEDCGKIRSVEAYRKNPEVIAAGVDPEEPLVKDMILLKFTDAEDRRFASLNWFGVHPTNMGEKNTLVSGDNKGYAEELMEKRYGGVHAFANSCCGDISPNVGYGVPDGIHDKALTKLFGKKQFNKAAALYDTTGQEVAGSLDYRHIFIKMSDWPIDGTNRKTWPGAFGYGMLNGSSEDSKGLQTEKWKEGTTTDNFEPAFDIHLEMIRAGVHLIPGLNWVSERAYPPEYSSGHAPKPIVFPVGIATYKNLPLVPDILPLQQIRLGNLLLAAHPGELTTVAGIRLRRALMEIFNGEIREVIVCGYANAFSSYTTTEEEYAQQHYEGASTLYGPWSLQAFIQEHVKIANKLKAGEDVGNDILPPPLRLDDLFTKSDVRRADTPLGAAACGTCVTQPKSRYQRGDTVSAYFVAANPDNNLDPIGGTYFKILKKNEPAPADWEVVYSDKDFSTEFRLLNRGPAYVAQIDWETTTEDDAGVYKIQYFGDAMDEHGALHPVTDSSREFQLI